MKRGFVVASLTFSLSTCLFGQGKEPATPIKAKQRQLAYEIQADGSKVLKHKQEGTFYRSSSGAEMYTMDGRSSFIDDQGTYYRIVHSKKLAVREGQNNLLSYEMIKQTPTESILGYEMVYGFHCAVRTVLLNGKPAGKEYVHIPYGLEVRMEFRNGSWFTVRELYDIEVAEPDASLVKIPKGYSMADETEK
jgi:hypothetical protein